MEVLTFEEIKALQKKKHKYQAKPIETKDGRFDSKKEWERWEQLKLLNKAKAISRLSRKRSCCTFKLRDIEGTIICKYVADFVYTENGQRIAEYLRTAGLLDTGG